MAHLPYDPALPDLGHILPHGGVPSLVVKAVQGMTSIPFTAEAGEVRYVRYWPARECIVLWSFPTPYGAPLLVSGRLFGNEGAGLAPTRSTLQRLAEECKTVMPGVASPYRYLYAQQLLLQLFPLDAGLPGLRFAASGSWMRELFAERLGTGVAETCTAEVIPSSYKPWRRCVFRFEAQSGEGHARYFGKVFRDSRGQALFDNLRAINGHLASVDGAWNIVTPVLYAGGANLLVFEEAQGGVEVDSEFLGQALDDPLMMEKLRGVVARSVEGLACFQRVPVKGLRYLDPTSVLNQIARRTKGLDRVAPRVAEAAKRCLRALEAEAGELKPESPALTHGAFRHDQFFVSGSALFVADLDTLCLSGASADAGNFLAHLDVTALRHPEMRPVVQEMEGVFIRALDSNLYADPRWLDWRRAASDVKYSLRPFLSLSPRWPELTAGLLDAARSHVAALGLRKVA